MSQKQWGNITWILFHTLAEKIKDDEFNNVKPIFINFIKDTCINLPCPICANHATENISKSRINYISKKSDMIEFLRQFHNIVNKKINKPIQEKEIVLQRYKMANLINIIRKFNVIYSIKYGNFEVNAFHRSNMRQMYLKRANEKLSILLKAC